MIGKKYEFNSLTPLEYVLKQFPSSSVSGLVNFKSGKNEIQFNYDERLKAYLIQIQATVINFFLPKRKRKNFKAHN